jgi:hypothetical protein
MTAGLVVVTLVLVAASRVRRGAGRAGIVGVTVPAGAGGEALGVHVGLLRRAAGIIAPVAGGLALVTGYLAISRSWIDAVPLGILLGATSGHELTDRLLAGGPMPLRDRIRAARLDPRWPAAGLVVGLAVVGVVVGLTPAGLIYGAVVGAGMGAGISGVRVLAAQRQRRAGLDVTLSVVLGCSQADLEGGAVPWGVDGDSIVIGPPLPRTAVAAEWDDLAARVAAHMPEYQLVPSGRGTLRLEPVSVAEAARRESSESLGGLAAEEAAGGGSPAQEETIDLSEEEL